MAKVPGAQIWVLISFFLSDRNVRLTLFSHCRSTPVYKLLISRAQLFSLWLPSHAFLPRKSLCGNHFTSGVLICRGRSLQKQVKRVTFAPNRKFLPISQPFFSPQSETLDMPAFCHFWDGMQGLTSIWLLSTISHSSPGLWSEFCVLVFVERFLV